jgi:hypothetical protein
MHDDGDVNPIALSTHSPSVVRLHYWPSVRSARYVHDVTDNPFIVPVLRELRFRGPARAMAMPAAPAIALEDVRDAFRRKT